MKNQYFADVNDYRKYGLLRILTGLGVLKTAIGWMLTEGDQRGDGKFIRYLTAPKRWKRHDPELFDSLQACLAQSNGQTVSSAEDHNLIPAAIYYSELLASAPSERQRYFNQLRQLAVGQDLVFFDPDNGIEVKSVAYGSRYSNKYIYWRELADFFAASYSLLVYQHFAREERGAFIQKRIDQFYERMPGVHMFAFSTPRVVFFLAAQPRHAETFGHACERIQTAWRGQITPKQFLQPPD